MAHPRSRAGGLLATCHVFATLCADEGGVGHHQPAAQRGGHGNVDKIKLPSTQQLNPQNEKRREKCENFRRKRRHWEKRDFYHLRCITHPTKNSKFFDSCFRSGSNPGLPARQLKGSVPAMVGVGTPKSQTPSSYKPTTPPWTYYVHRCLSLWGEA